jgi:ribosomal protein S18 acetylase RimI-like enzyme
MGFDIRPAADGELDACARLMSGSEPWLTLRLGPEACLRVVRDPSREKYAAVDGSVVLGVIVLSMGGPFKGYVQAVVVDPGQRGRGVGRALLAFAEERIFRETPNVFLCVSSFNSGARRLYEALGYRQVGEIPDYVVPGHSEFLLRKTTGPLSGSRSAPLP